MAITPQNQPYQSPTPGEITLMAFSPNTGTSPMSSALCQDLRDCGFNSAAVETTQQNAWSTINNCKNYGIKPFLHVAGMEDSVAKCQPYVNLYKKATGLGGWMLKSGVTQSQVTEGSNLAEVADSIRKTDQFVTIEAYDKYVKDLGRNNVVKEEVSIKYPHPIFMSALSAADFPHQSDSRAKSASEELYKNYIEAFQDNLQPSFWPFLTFPTVVDSTTFPLQDFYRDLEIFSLMVRYTNSPMWPYISCRTETGYGNILPVGTEARLRSAAFSALAYGAQGLVWWTYGPTKSLAGQDVNGLIDGNGNKTGLWNVVKRINTRISALNLIFNGCRPVECRHTGTTYYVGTCLLKGAIGPVVSLLTGSAGVLVSHISNEGDDYLVIVNHPGAPTQKLTIDFSKQFGIERSSIASDGLISWNSISSYNLEINLPAGEMEIFRWW